MGINVNIYKFTYNYNVGIGSYGYNYTYHESEYSSWSLGYGLNGFEGYVGINNTLQNSNGISVSTNFTGSFNGLDLLAAVMLGKASSSGSISEQMPKSEILTN